MNPWQLLFLQSKANDNHYFGDNLATQNWAWPQETWFQKRLRQQRRKPWLSEALWDADAADLSRPRMTQSGVIAVDADHEMRSSELRH